jgi:hypothetical protein
MAAPVSPADLVRDLGEHHRRKRRVLSRLDHHGATGSERRRNLPRKHQQREVPRNNLPDDARRLVAGELFIPQLRPTRMMIKMPRHERNVDVACLADALAVVECLQHRKPPRVLLHLPRQGIKILRALMPGERLPRRQGLGSGCDGCVDIRARAERDRGKELAGGWVAALECAAEGSGRAESSGRARDGGKGAVNVMAEGTPVRIEPLHHLACIFERRPIFHALELFHDCACHAVAFAFPVVIPGGNLCLF